MAFFLYNSNKSRVDVDGLNGRLFSTIRSLLIFCVLTFFVIQAVLPPPLAATTSLFSAYFTAGDRTMSARLVCREISESAVTLVISLDGVSLCGLLATVTYDASAVKFSSARLDSEIADQGGELSYAGGNGVLTLALDCFCNLPLGDVIELTFAFDDPAVAETVFELSVLSAYSWESEELIRLPHFEASAVTISTERTADRAAPILNSVESSVSGDISTLLFCGTAPERAFAAGIDLCIADLSSFAVERVCAVGVISQSGEKNEFIRFVELPAKGRFCVIVKPVSYCRTGAVFGREIILLIENGTVLH